MSNIMSCTWASFIRCGAPRCSANPPNCDDVLSDLVDWPEFSESARNYFSFKLPPSLEAIQPTSIFNVSDEFPGDDRCDFWDAAHLDWRDVTDRIKSKWFFPLAAETFAALV
jgi:hypothetical protein